MAESDQDQKIAGCDFCVCNLQLHEGPSVKGTLYALPFYAESSMTYYRTDLFKDSGLTFKE